MTRAEAQRALTRNPHLSRVTSAAWLGIDDGDERAAWEVRGEVARGYAVRVMIEGRG